MYFLDTIAIPPVGISNPGGGITNVARVFDGDLSSEAVLTASNGIAQVDLGEASALGLLRLKVDMNGLSQLRVQSSADGSHFSNVDSHPVGNGEWHIISMPELSSRYWRFIFGRAVGVTTVHIAALDLFQVLADFEADDTDRPVEVHSRFFDPQQRSLRAGSNRLVSFNSPSYISEITVEWHRLASARVDALKAVLQRDEDLTIIPDPYREPEKDYRVRRTSPFDFTETVPGNWTLGKSGTVVFEER